MLVLRLIFRITNLPEIHRHKHTGQSPWWLVCLPQDTKVAGSNPAKAIDF
jgi:hypothetical protein